MPVTWMRPVGKTNWKITINAIDHQLNEVCSTDPFITIHRYSHAHGPWTSENIYATTLEWAAQRYTRDNLDHDNT